MRTTPPLLAPLFRSEGQARLLAELLLGGDELSVPELAERIGLAYPTVWREVGRLVDAGLLQERTLGRVRLVSANPTSPLTKPVREILLVSTGPVPLLREELASIEGIVHAFLFGSFAARMAGVEGPAPNDIDVMVVGEPEPLAVYQACQRVGDLVGRPVNPTILSVEEWRVDETAFLSEVRTNPTINIVGDINWQSRL